MKICAKRRTGAYEACTGSGWWNVALSGLSADVVVSVVLGAASGVCFSSSSGFEAHRDRCMIRDRRNMPRVKSVRGRERCGHEWW
jgi:hypothetical protein